MRSEQPGELSQAARKMAQTVCTILQAAEDEFAQAGLDNAKMERIAARAHVSKQLVYHYFGSKTELYHEVLKSLARSNHQALLAVDYAGMPPQAAIRRYIEVFFDQYYDRPASAAVTVDQTLHAGLQIEWDAKTREDHDRLSDAVAQTLERGKREGVFSPDLSTEDFEYMTIVIISGSVMSRAMFQKMRGLPPGRQGERGYWKTYATDFIMRALRP